MVCWIHFIFFVRWGAHKYKKKKSGYRYIVSRYNVLKKKNHLDYHHSSEWGSKPKLGRRGNSKIAPTTWPPPKEERFVCMHPLYTRPLVKLKLNWSLANNKIFYQLQQFVCAIVWFFFFYIPITKQTSRCSCFVGLLNDFAVESIGIYIVSHPQTQPAV